MKKRLFAFFILFVFCFSLSLFASEQTTPLEDFFAQEIDYRTEVQRLQESSVEFQEEGNKIIRMNTKTSEREVFYESERKYVSFLKCVDEWGFFVEHDHEENYRENFLYDGGYDLIFYHKPTNTVRKTEIETRRLNGITVYTNRIVGIRQINPVYVSAMDAAGITFKDLMVQDAEGFAAWIKENLGRDDIDAESLRKSKIDFANICEYILNIRVYVERYLDVSTGIFYGDPESVPSQVFQTRWAEIMQAMTPNPPAESDGTGESSSSDSEVISTDGAVTDLPPGQITQSAGTSSVPASEEGGTSLDSLWICVGVGGLLVCGGLLILLLKKKK